MEEKLTTLKTDNNRRRRLQVLLLIILIPLFTALYLAGVPNNPPGFYIDESSIAYNAHTISQTGRDEFEVSWPLYFRAFGEYKNPSYIYLLAALYHLFGPSIFVARLLSVVLGLMAALLLGILAKQMTGQRSIGMIVGVIAMFTPWFFELSRLVLEVALYPLALALFLLVLYQSSIKASWSLLNSAGLALTLALLTYSYSTGRLLAPLLAVGLIIFVTGERLKKIIQTWVLYALTLIPLLVFNHTHPGALLTKFRWATYITPQSTALSIVRDFIQHYAGNVSPWNVLFIGDSNPAIHIPGMGAMLLAPALMIAGGIILVLFHHRRDPWWGFMLYGVVVSIVPASLTRDQFPSLRLIALPIFLLVFSIPALIWLFGDGTKQHTRRVLLACALILTALQAAIFQWQFHGSQKYSSARLAVFDAGYPELFTAAAAAGKPIYLSDQPSQPGYIQAYWYGTLRGLDISQFVRLPSGTAAPAEAVVITTEENFVSSAIIAKTGPYTAYRATASRFTVVQGTAPLPDRAFKAKLEVTSVPATLLTGQKQTIYVTLKNISDLKWPSLGQSDGNYLVRLGDHWLDPSHRIAINDDARAELLHDLEPGDNMSIPLLVTAPEIAGDYVLEIDLVQEGVAWFGQKGSQTWRGAVRVESGSDSQSSRWTKH
jgi:4-amino-4-deoxy-L-arabinose transferase-like glycosyltransferase